MSPAPFDHEDVRRVAALARLRLTDAEIDGFVSQLGSVMEHMAALDDGAGEPPDELPYPESGLRPDTPGPDPLARPPADFAPGFTDGFFAVPRLPAFDPAAGPDPPPG